MIHAKARNLISGEIMDVVWSNEWHMWVKALGDGTVFSYSPTAIEIFDKGEIITTAEPNEIQAVSTIKSEPDWEERRFELTKEFAIRNIWLSATDEATRSCIQHCVKCADFFIDEYKKHM